MPVNEPASPNAETIQGPSPDGVLGYPVKVIPTPGSASFPVSVISSVAGSTVVTDIQDGAGVSIMDAALIAAKVSVVQTVAPQDRSASGSISNTSQEVPISTIGMAVVTARISGAFSGTLRFRGTIDGVNFSNIPAWNIATVLTTSGVVVATGVGSFIIPCSGYMSVKIDTNSFASGTATINLEASVAPSSIVENVINLASAITGLTDVQTNSVTTLTTGFTGYPTYPLNFNGTNWERVRTPVIFKTVQALAAGNTALWTPAAGKKFRLMRYHISLTENCTLAAPAVLTVSLFDAAAGVTGQAHDIFVPAIALATSGNLYVSPWIDMGNGFLSALANNVLNVNLSAALATGNVRVICCGTEE